MAKKPLEIDGIVGSQLRDSQGEMLSVEGADITELEAGYGRFNDNHGKGFFNSVGRVKKAKKILKEEDCENERHKHYWDKVKSPFIYVSGYLYDDEDHPNARAAAAILRNIHKEDSPLKLKASVEGGIVKRGDKDPSLLATTKIHSIALTFTPANKATLIEPISLAKSETSKEDEILIKSVMHLAQDNVPNFIDISNAISNAIAMHKIEENVIRISEIVDKLKKVGSKIEMPNNLKRWRGKIPKDHSHHRLMVNYINKIHRSGSPGSRSEARRLYEKHINLKSNVYSLKVKKALTAGYGGAGSPTENTQGAVLQTESLEGGRKGFKRISCDDCGFDQIMAKDQIKCRKCGTAFSLEKVYSSMVDYK